MLKYDKKIDPRHDADELNIRLDLMLKRLRQKPKKEGIKSLYHAIQFIQDYQTHIATSYHDMDLEKLIEN